MRIRYLKNKTAILINGFKPSGILARDAIKGDFVYNNESKFYSINNEISENKDMSMDEDMDFER